MADYEVPQSLLDQNSGDSMDAFAQTGGKVSFRWGVGVGRRGSRMSGARLLLLELLPHLGVSSCAADALITDSSPFFLAPHTSGGRVPHAGHGLSRSSPYTIIAAVHGDPGLRGQCHRRCAHARLGCPPHGAHLVAHPRRRPRGAHSAEHL